MVTHMYEYDHIINQTYDHIIRHIRQSSHMDDHYQRCVLSLIIIIAIIIILVIIVEIISHMDDDYQTEMSSMLLVAYSLLQTVTYTLLAR